MRNFLREISDEDEASVKKMMIKMEYMKGYKLTEFLLKYPERKDECKSLLQHKLKKMIG